MHLGIAVCCSILIFVHACAYRYPFHTSPSMLRMHYSSYSSQPCQDRSLLRTFWQRKIPQNSALPNPAKYPSIHLRDLLSFLFIFKIHSIQSSHHLSILPSLIICQPLQPIHSIFLILLKYYSQDLHVCLHTDKKNFEMDCTGRE